MMMTKDEVKREYKEMEGSQEVKRLSDARKEEEELDSINL